MSIPRRTVLGAGAMLGAAGLTGCERVLSLATRLGGQGLPEGPLAETAAAAIDPSFHLLSRAAFGPWPGDVERVRAMGHEAWVDEQLAPESIDDRLCDLRARRFESLHASPGELFEFRREVIRRELTRATVLRAVYSRRQLLEVMVRFWSDHLNVDLGKGDCAHLVPADDREVIRRHALGRFRDLIGASALSPAMLVYLDGTENRRRNPRERPNENYARELLELHTLGIEGGYTQQDVAEAARCLTGWSVRRGRGRGAVDFDPQAHDQGEKRVLGARIPAGGGEEDLERLLDLVCAHPATARHVSRKLCVRLVAEEAPSTLVDRVARVFQETGGEIRPMVRAVLLSSEFERARGAKFKRPFRFLVSALRAVGADTHCGPAVTEALERLGQPPFQHPTPDGYPDLARPWMGTLLWRWNLALALASGTLPGVEVDRQGLTRGLHPGGGRPPPARTFSYLVGRAPTPRELQAIEGVYRTRPALGLGLVLASPAYQWS